MQAFLQTFVASKGFKSDDTLKKLTIRRTDIPLPIPRPLINPTALVQGTFSIGPVWLWYSLCGFVGYGKGGLEFACEFREDYLKLKPQKPEGRFLIWRWVISLWSHCFNWHGTIVGQGLLQHQYLAEMGFGQSFVVNHGHNIPEDWEPLSHLVFLCLSLILFPLSSWFGLFFGMHLLLSFHQ